MWDPNWQLVLGWQAWQAWQAATNLGVWHPLWLWIACCILVVEATNQ